MPVRKCGRQERGSRATSGNTEQKPREDVLKKYQMLKMYWNQVNASGRYALASMDHQELEIEADIMLNDWTHAD